MSSLKIDPDLIQKPKKATATTNTALSVTEGLQKLTLNTLNSNSEELTLSGGGIRIGKNIYEIEVCGAVFAETPQPTGYNWLKIRKGATDVATNLTAGGMSYKHAATPTSQTISVVEGDIIFLYCDIAGAGTPSTIRTGFQNTWLCVKVLK